jgi:hypothetical protein
MILRSALLGFLLAGCDPGYAVSGRVSEADGGGLREVVVTLECDGHEVLSGQRTTQSQDGGLFLLMGVGCIPEQCRLSFKHPGGTVLTKLTCHSRSFMCARTACSEAEAEVAF